MKDKRNNTILKEKVKNYIPTIITAILSLVCWEFIVRAFSISKWILPGPIRIFIAFYQQRVLLFQHSLRTFYEAVIGLTLSSLTGLLIGGIIFHFKILRKTLYPFLVISQTVPIVVLVPLLVIWLGYGITPKLVIVILACFFPVAVNTVDGLAAADREKIQLLCSMGASRWQIFKLIRIPSALPMIMSGLRIAATYAVMAAVVAEWMGSDMGLGVYIVRSSNSYLTERVFGGIILVSFLSIMFFQFVNLLEKKIIYWKNDK